MIYPGGVPFGGGVVIGGAGVTGGEGVTGGSPGPFPLHVGHLLKF